MSDPVSRRNLMLVFLSVTYKQRPPLLQSVAAVTGYRSLMTWNCMVGYILWPYLQNVCDTSKEFDQMGCDDDKAYQVVWIRLLEREFWERILFSSVSREDTLQNSFSNLEWNWPLLEIAVVCTEGTAGWWTSINVSAVLAREWRLTVSGWVCRIACT